MRVLQTKPTKTCFGYWSFVAAALLAGFYFATVVYAASRHNLFVDEIITVLVARLPGWTAICKALAEGADVMPPTYHMVVRVFDNLFGHTDVAARLPSALGMAVGLLLTFDCARRLTDGLHGLIALSVLTCSYLPFYGGEARSYGLYFMLAALALWVWTQAREEKRSSAVAFGAVLFLCITMHYYAVLCLVPYAVWEISNWKPWRLPSQKMLGGMLGVLCAAVVLSGSIQASRRSFADPESFPPRFWATPSDLLLLFSSHLSQGFFPDGLFLLAMSMVWIAWAGRRDKTIPLDPMLPGERVGWFFICIPLAGYLLAKVTHVFVPRYFICALPGIAVAFSCWLWRHFGTRWRVSAGILLLLVAWGLARQVSMTRHPEYALGFDNLTRQQPKLEEALGNDGKRFFLVPNHLLYWVLRQYSRHPDQYAMPLFSDDPRLHDTIVMGQYYPVHLWTLQDLKKHTRETALIGAPPSSLDGLKQAGFQIKIRFAQPIEVVYLE
jgi:hypothetical protein